jgi:hypothetical protein
MGDLIIHTDRPAEVTSLLERVSDAYYSTLDPHEGEHGLSYANEIILRVVLEELLKAGMTTSRKMQKVLQFLPQHSEYLVE